MAGPIRIAVLANARQAKAELNSVANTTQGLGSRFRRAGALIGASIGGAAVVGALGKTIGLAKDFDLTMRQVGVQTGQTGQQLKGLSDLAMKMGADTVFSAQDASNAMLELAKGGLTAADIRAGALKTTMTLAAAGELEMGRAAEYVTQGMNTFGLAASQADRVATALAGGANASTASVESLGMALSQVGPGAKNAGLSLEETVAALSAFDNAGIKGSDAGTSLKTMLTRLVPATKGASTAMESVGLWTEKSGSAFVNANGTFKSMAQISGLLQRKLSGLSDAHRQQALQAIFGSDATRAATVLMNEGAKGITKYVKATKDQTTVQKMANTAMEGFSGAWEGLTGSIETVGIKLGTALLPMLTKATKYVDGSVVPAIEDMVDWFSRNSDEIESTASSIGKTLLPPLRVVGDVLKTVGKAASTLPEPVRNLGIQAGIAALALPRLTAAMTATGAGFAAVGTGITTSIAKVRQFHAEMTYTATRTQRVQAAMVRLGDAARTVAGIGGMIALSEGARRGNKSLTALGGGLTGAALGATAGSAVFPGVGTAIGAVGGAAVGTFGSLVAMERAERRAAEAAADARNKSADYATTLDQVSGAATRVTRQTALQSAQQAGILSLTNRLGVNTRDVIGAVLGQAGATRRLNAAAAENFDLLRGDEQAKFNTWLQKNTNDLADQRAELLENNRATATWREILKGLPKGLRTEIKQMGAEASMRQVRQLAREYKISPKRLLTRVELAGVNVTGKRLGQIKRELRQTGNTRIGNKWLQFFVGDLNRGRRHANRGGKDIGGALRRGTSGARPNLTGFNKTLLGQIGLAEKRSRRGGLTVQSFLERGTKSTKADLRAYYRGIDIGLQRSNTKAKSQSDGLRRNLEKGPKTAKANTSGFSSGLLAQLRALSSSSRSSASGIGSGIGAGLNSGIAAWTSAIAATAAAAVRAAVNAARNAAQVRSPSRKTRQIGEQMGEGLVVGMRRKHKGAKEAGKKFVRELLKGIGDGTQGVNKVLSRITDLVRKRVDLKNAKAEKARENQILKGLAARYKALRKNAAAQDRINQRLKNEKAHLKELQQARKAYAAAVKEGVVSYGSVISVGQDEGFGSVQQMLDRMAERVKQAQQWSTMLEKLKKAGLNKTSLDQLAQAGIEGGFGTAQTLLSGGSNAIQQVNQFTAQLQAAGAKAGETTAGVMYDSGIKAAQGLIKGLQAKAAQLDQWARQIGRKLAAAVRKALGIRSPSRVFADIGKQTVAGLRIGLDETYVKQSAVKLSDALVGGFGQPALEAYVAGQGGAGAGMGNTYKIEVNVSPGASPVDVGREIVKAIKAYQGSGGAVTL